MNIITENQLLEPFVAALITELKLLRENNPEKERDLDTYAWENFDEVGEIVYYMIEGGWGDFDNAPGA